MEKEKEDILHTENQKERRDSSRIQKERPRRKKNRFQRVVSVVAGGILLLICLPLTIYIPWVQDFARKQVENYMEKHTDYRLSFNRLRLSFPLNLIIDNADVVTVSGDTLAHCGTFRVKVALWPLFQQKVSVREFALNDLRMDYADTVSRFELFIQVGGFDLQTDQIDLKKHWVGVKKIDLSDGKVFLNTGISSPDTSASGPLPPWMILADELSLNRVAFAMKTETDEMNLAVRMGTADIESCKVSLEEQKVMVKELSVEGISGSFLTDTLAQKAVPQTPQEQEVTDSLPPWSIAVGKVALAADSLSYGIKQGQPAKGLDLNHMVFSKINLLVDSVYNCGSQVQLNLKNLSLVERSGLRVNTMQGEFIMDSTGIYLSDFMVHTAASSLAANVSAGAGVWKMNPATPVTLSFTADLALKELLNLYPLPDTSAIEVLGGKHVRLNADLGGWLDRLFLNTVEVAMPGHFEWGMNGRLHSWIHPEQMEGEVQWRGDFSKIRFLKACLSDTALRRRIDLPPFRWKGTATLQQGEYAARMNLWSAGGGISIDAGFNPERERYQVRVQCDSFPLNRFLPEDSLNVATLELGVSGAGWDVYAPTTRAQMELQIKQFEYRGYDYGGTMLKAGLMENQWSGELSATGEALKTTLNLDGTWTENRKQMKLQGVLDTVDLYRMHFSSAPLGFATCLTAEAELLPEIWRIKTQLDSTALKSGLRSVQLKKLALSAWADSLRTEMNLKSGDLQLNFHSPLSPDSLLARMQQTASVIAQQIEEEGINMAAFDSLLPPFRLTADAEKDNVLNDFLKLQGVSMGRLALDAEVPANQSFNFDLMINWLDVGGVRTDTVALIVGQETQKLEYALRLANAPQRADIFSALALEGYLLENHGEVTVKQYDKNGRIGFDFGLRGEVLDSLWRISMFPENPVLGFSSWSLNPDNYLIYRPPYQFEADFSLTNGPKKVLLSSARHEGVPEGSVEFKISDVRIDTLLKMIPGLPPMGGVLQTSLLLGMSDTAAGTAGQVRVDELSYDGQPVGNVGLNLLYRLEKEKLPQLYAGIQLNDDEVMTVQSDTTASAGEGMQLEVAIPAFPIAVANAFLPPDVADLSGILKGQMHLNLAKAPLIDGWLCMDSTRIEVPMIGTAFGLVSDTVSIRQNKIELEGLALTAPNGQKLRLSGNADLYDFSDISLDVRADASDFQVINVPRNRKSTLFGKANVDLHASVKGLLDALTVRGHVNLLGGTEVTYVMHDSPMDLQNKPQNVVTFVSFQDTTRLYEDNYAPASLKIGGMDLLANLEINEDARMSIFLSEDGNNRISLQGGGNLTYTVNPLGDTRFAGRYTLSGGTVRYNPPIISSKVFNIVRGGYVDWTGNMLDPALNITAVETVRTNVSTDDGNNSRPVNFNVSIYIRNTLNDLSITFDLSAPEDLTIQNQLTSMTAEQRSVQAMNMLIYNTYSAPGTSSSNNTANPLNSFIQKELNQWAQNNLKGVDLSFGIDTYNTVATGAESSRTDYSYKVSKSLFNNQVRAVIGGKYSSDSDPNENLKENLVDDISLEYMFSRRDNMFLKVFRHTGYESILEGEITETGFGFVTRKKLLRLRDLFRLTRNRQERQENREKRKEKKISEMGNRVQNAQDTSRNVTTQPMVEPLRNTEYEK